jgi:branched-chain amino acid transport system substrate-binding protein
VAGGGGDSGLREPGCGLRQQWQRQQLRGQQFRAHAAYGVYPSYYSEAGYTKAEILVDALKSLHGDVTSEKALGNAMRAVTITAPRGPVSLSKVTWSPIENEYICKVESVNGAMRNVPILTYPAVPPWGTLTRAEWAPLFARTSVSPPSY